MRSVDEYVSSLYLSNAIREPVIRKILKELNIPLSSFGLDAGCGIGLYSLLLADMVGPQGHVAGIDINEEFLEKAYASISESGLKDRITFKVGDISKIPFSDNSFDWAGSIDLVGGIAENPVLLLKELKRVVKPGGLVFILVWSSQSLLSGYPLLEAQLNATSAGIAPFAKNMNPERHIMCACQWFKQAGFQGTAARTFVGDISAPLSIEIRDALTDLFIMRWGTCKEEVAPEVWQKYQNLCLPDSPHFILNLPDYYAFFTYSLFYGYVARK